MREGLRALMAGHNDAAVPDDARALADMAALAARIRLIAVPISSAATGHLRPVETGSARAGLAWLLIALALGQASAQWRWVKACADPDCREAFRDTTRNHSRTWCSMQVCGARAKQRNFAARYRGGSPPSG